MGLRRPQQATLTGRGEFKHLLREGNACEAKFDSAGALGCYERALQLDGGSCEALLRCSKALSDLTLEPGTPSGDAQAMVRRNPCCILRSPHCILRSLLKPPLHFKEPN